MRVRIFLAFALTALLAASVSACDSGGDSSGTTGSTGTATSTTAGLSGAVEVRLHSLYNTTTKLGWVDGWLKVRGNESRTTAHLTAVNVDGKLDGWLRGHAGRGHGTLFGSFTATFDKATGLPERRYIDSLLVRVQEVMLTRKIGDAMSAMRRMAADAHSDPAAARALSGELQDLQRELAQLRDRAS